MTATSERTRRFFIALWPADELRSAIEHETVDAVRQSAGRRIAPDNFHITLVFLGSVAVSRTSDVFASIAKAQIPQFEFTLSRVVWWPRQELLCLEPPTIPDALAATVERLRSTLDETGFAVERRRFHAHLTLARDVRREFAFSPIKELRWQVNRVELIESRMSSRGSTYTVLSQTAI